MPRTRSSSGKKRRGKRTLRAQPFALAEEEETTLVIPVRWVNAVIALFLLPLAGILTQTFFTCLSRETLNHAFWATEEFWFFGLGALLWTIAFFGLPRPVLIYVFGHELTHALWVWMMGGRVTAFKVGRDGGHIITDTHNFWIALAPYFFPLYSAIVIGAYGIAGLFWDVTPYRELLFGLIGLTWAFHISFTLWMIPKGQTDLTYYGTFFSLVIIYIFNLAILALFLVIASGSVTFASFGNELLENAIEFSSWVTSLRHSSL